MAQVQLIFSGEVLEGFLAADVRRKLGERLKLDGPKLDKLFSGRRMIIKRGLSAPVANQWVAQFRAMGAKLHVLDEPLALHPVMDAVASTSPAQEAVPPTTIAAPVAPTLAQSTPASAKPAGLALVPLAADPHAAPPQTPVALTAPVAPVAPASEPATDDITCPVCGEEQPRRILCRVCAADMPRGIANKLAEEQAERNHRREEQMARRGTRPGHEGMRGERAAAGAASRLSSARSGAKDDDVPLFGLSFDGRIGRMRYLLGGLVFLLAAMWLGILAVLMPGMLTGVLAVIALAFGVVWGIRLAVLRLHDVGLGGWWVLLSLVPWVGQIGSLVLMLWPGQDDDNAHGSPPSRENAMPAIAALVALSLTVGWGYKTAMGAFEQKVRELQEEAGSEEPGLDDDETVQPDFALPPAAELRRVLHSDVAAGEFRGGYAASPVHRAFAISNAGAWGGRGGAAMPNQAAETALADCERRRKPYTPECRVVHVNGDWVMN